MIGGELNMLPKTYRQYIDSFESGKYAEAALIYADLKRFNHYVAQWRGAHPRWIKMMMTVFRMPGWEGGILGPYRMPAAEELQRFADGLLKLHMPEIDELARAAGMPLPS